VSFAPEYRRPRILSALREHLRDTFWFAPTAGLAGAIVLWIAAATVDEAIVDHLRDRRAYAEIGDLTAIAEDAKTIVIAVSSAMMTSSVSSSASRWWPCRWPAGS
jgi:hypothetical protein